MRFAIRLAPFSEIDAYESVPIHFEVRERLEVNRVAETYVLTSRPSERPYIKDYDAHPDERPSQWSRRFDVSNWQLFLAHDWNRPVGGAAIARGSSELEMLEGRTDLAVLWDLRVRPDARRAGIGSALFAAAERWASEHGSVQLKVETQNTNAPACRFYHRQGCRLGAIKRGAYPALPDEIQLLWYKELMVSPEPNPRGDRP